MNDLFRKYFDETFLDEYCSGIFSDELDKHGYKDQVIPNWHLNNSKLRLFGRARTLTVESIETEDERITKGLTFLGNLAQDDVLVVKGSMNFAYFGELMTRLSKEVGVSGSIIDGLTRDTYYTQDVDFPILARGYSPVDIKGRGRVDELDVKISISDVMISSGDFIFADSDAVVVMPKEIFLALVPQINGAAIEEYEIKKKIANGHTVKEILLSHKSF